MFFWMCFLNHEIGGVYDTKHLLCLNLLVHLSKTFHYETPCAILLSYNLFITCLHESWIYLQCYFHFFLMLGKKFFFFVNKQLYVLAFFFNFDFSQKLLPCRKTKQNLWKKLVDSGFVKTCDEHVNASSFFCLLLVVY